VVELEKRATGRDGSTAPRNQLDVRRGSAITRFGQGQKIVGVYFREPQATRENRERPLCASCKKSFRRQTRAEDEGEMTMKVLVVLAAVCFSTTANAQDASKVGNKPLTQVKPERADGLQTGRNGQGHKDLGW
jgi:hypothetical protein